MKETKIRLALFTISEYEKEQEWLAKQHKAGWKLVDATLPCFYRFEKCEPEEVVYQLDYNEERMAQNDEYIQMFEDCGWEYITEMAGYSYFCKPISKMNGEEEIFSDDASKLDMIERVFKGRMLPMLVVFFLIIIPQLTGMIHQGFSTGKLVVFGVYAVVFVMYVTIFIRFGVQYTRLKKKIEK